MVHENYNEVSAKDPAGLGQVLGCAFGAIVRDYIDEEREGKAWAQQKGDAQVLLARTAQLFPAYVAELEAYAGAARVPLIDLWTMSISDELDDDDTEKCTTVVTNGGRLISHNEDWDADATEDICILKKTCGDVTTLELYYYGCPLGGAALSICSNGYVQAINSLNNTDWQVGVPKLVIGRRIAELRDANAELAQILSIPRSSGFAHNLVDRSGRITAVECTATRQVVRQPEAPFVHTNHMLDAALGPLQGETDGQSTFRRYEEACRMVRPSMGDADMMQLASDQTCGKTNSIFNRNTIARGVVDLDRSTASFWLRREKEKGWVDYPIGFFGSAAATV